MKHYAQILILLLTTLVWLLGGMCNVPCRSGDCQQTNVAEDHNHHENTALYSLSSAPSALPVQVEKVRIASIQLTARQQHRLISASVFGRPADMCKALTTTISIVRSRHLLPSLAPPDISFPFSSFW